MAKELLKGASQAVEDWWFDPLKACFGFINLLSGYKRITNPLQRQQILTHWERPGWKPVFYKAAGKLRELWGLPLEPDTQTAISEFFINVNTSHWEPVVRAQEQVLDFFRSGAKDALGEVTENLHKQWERGIPVVKELIGRHTYGMGVPDVRNIVGITEDQPVTQQIARLLDPYFEQHLRKAFPIGERLCQEHGIPIEEGISWGVRWGFIKRNTIDLAKEDDLTRRGEIFKWLNNDAQVDRALQRLTADLDFNYSGTFTKLC